MVMRQGEIGGLMKKALRLVLLLIAIIVVVLSITYANRVIKIIILLQE